MACVAFFDMTSIDTVKSTDKMNWISNLTLHLSYASVIMKEIKLLYIKKKTQIFLFKKKKKKT